MIFFVIYPLYYIDQINDLEIHVGPINRDAGGMTFFKMKI
jgi:hypothetical protein